MRSSELNDAVATTKPPQQRHLVRDLLVIPIIDHTDAEENGVGLRSKAVHRLANDYVHPLIMDGAGGNLGLNLAHRQRSTDGAKACRTIPEHTIGLMRGHLHRGRCRRHAVRQGSGRAHLL
eukprot:6829313-Prymnesium_polylepis.2